MRIMKKGMSAGFTLMELVIIMVILAILAASAVPKYLDLKTSAETAAKEGMTGVVRSAFAVAVRAQKQPNGNRACRFGSWR